MGRVQTILSRHDELRRVDTKFESGSNVEPTTYSKLRRKHLQSTLTELESKDPV